MQHEAFQTERNGEPIAEALAEVQNRLRHLRGERTRIEKLLAAAQEEEKLLSRLVALRSGQILAIVQDNAAPPHSERRSSEMSSEKIDCVQAVVDELAAAGRPLHISDLMRLLRDRSVPIPGAGNQANLISHIRRDERLVRTSRGMYGLKIWGIEDMPVKAVRKRRKLRVRSKAKS